MFTRRRFGGIKRRMTSPRRYHAEQVFACETYDDVNRPPIPESLDVAAVRFYYNEYRRKELSSQWNVVHSNKKRYTDWDGPSKRPPARVMTNYTPRLNLPKRKTWKRK